VYSRVRREATKIGHRFRSLVTISCRQGLPF
jgi:hypothetical protein